jgi:hypothetical protein
MNIIDMKDELEARLAKSATPQARLIVGILLVLLVAGLFWREFHPSKTQTVHEHATSSDQFGQALERAGIATQPEASH